MYDKIFKCTECNKIFKCKGDLNGPKCEIPCECDECNSYIICGTKIVTDAKVIVAFSL